MTDAGVRPGVERVGLSLGRRTASQPAFGFQLSSATNRSRYHLEHATTHPRPRYRSPSGQRDWTLRENHGKECSTERSLTRVDSQKGSRAEERSPFGRGKGANLHRHSASFPGARSLSETVSGAIRLNP